MVTLAHIGSRAPRVSSQSFRGLALALQTPAACRQTQVQHPAACRQMQMQHPHLISTMGRPVQGRPIRSWVKLPRHGRPLAGRRMCSAGRRAGGAAGGSHRCAVRDVCRGACGSVCGGLRAWRQAQGTEGGQRQGVHAPAGQRQVCMRARAVDMGRQRTRYCALTFRIRAFWQASLPSAATVGDLHDTPDEHVQCNSCIHHTVQGTARNPFP